MWDGPPSGAQVERRLESPSRSTDVHADGAAGPAEERTHMIPSPMTVQRVFSPARSVRLELRLAGSPDFFVVLPQRPTALRGGDEVRGADGRACGCRPIDSRGPGQ